MPDIIITPQRGTANNPSINFAGTTGQVLSAFVMPAGSLRFSGNTGTTNSILEIYGDNAAGIGLTNQQGLILSSFGTKAVAGLGGIPNTPPPGTSYAHFTIYGTLSTQNTAYLPRIQFPDGSIQTSAGAGGGGNFLPLSGGTMQGDLNMGGYAILNASRVQGNNFYDVTGTYNVNLGSGGSEGRGVVAGYSGGNYGGVGYNVRHTTSSGSYISPLADTSSYIRFTQGFDFLNDGSTTAGRATSFTYLARLNSTGLGLGGASTGPSFNLDNYYSSTRLSGRTYETLSRSIGGSTNDTVAIGNISNNGVGMTTKIRITAHNCGVIDILEFVCNEITYLGSNQNWLELPLVPGGASYSGSQKYAVDVYRQSIGSTGDPMYIRIRNKGGTCGAGTVNVIIEYDGNVTFTQQSTQNTVGTSFNASSAPAGGAVDGYFGSVAYQFPVTSGSGWQVSQGGLFIVNGGRVGINTESPVAGVALQVAGQIINSTSVNSTGDYGIALGNGYRLGFDQSGIRSWTLKAANNGINAAGSLTVNSGDGGGYLSTNVTGFLVNGTQFAPNYASATKLIIAPAWANGVANEKFDLYMTGAQNLWGRLRVVVCDAYNYQNVAGCLEKQFNLGLNPSNAIYVNQSRVVDEDGNTGDGYAISDLTWDAVNLRYRIQIVHRSTASNQAYIFLYWEGRDVTYTANFLTFTAGSIYTTDTTSYTRPRPYFNTNVGFGGQTNPAYTVDITGSAQVSNTLYVNTIRNTASDSMLAYSANVFYLGSGSASQFLVFNAGGSESTRITTGKVLLHGDTVSPGAVWNNSGVAVFGKGSTDKVILGYLASSTGGAVLGGHNSTLTAWATLNFNATTFYWRINETIGMVMDGSNRLGINKSSIPTNAQLSVSPLAQSWAEGIEINPASNNVAAVFYRTTADNTSQTWLLGRVASNFSLLREALTGSTGSSRADSLVDFAQATGYSTFGFNMGIRTAGSAAYALNVNGTTNLGGAVYYGGYLTASLFIRGTGLNNPANAFVALNGTILVNTGGRGLTLLILNKSNFTTVSNTTYDTYASGAASDNLATALNAMTNAQIGILVSYDAYEGAITSNLLTAARKKGLFKLAGTPVGGARRAYAAIFLGGGSTYNNRQVIEINENNAADANMSVISTIIYTDGSQSAGFTGNNLTNALVSGEPNTTDPAVFADSSGNVGVGTVTPAAKMDISYQGALNTTTPGYTRYGLHFSGQTTNDLATGITFSAGGATTSNANAGIYSQGSGGYGTKLYFATTDDYGVGAKTRMMINHQGFVGINQITPLARLHIVQNTPTSIGSLPSNVGLIMDNNNNNYILFRNTADNATFAGLQFQDNNVGGFIAFRNAGTTLYAGSDSMFYGTYQDHIFQAGSSETVGGKVEVARITSSAYLGVGNFSAGNYYPTQAIQTREGGFLGLPTAYGYVPTSWRRGYSGIIVAGSNDVNGGGWAYGTRQISLDYGDGLGYSFDSLYAATWYNNALFISGRSGRMNYIGLNTTAPDYMFHVQGGSMYLGSGNPGNWATNFTGFNRFIFDNSYSDIARGPNKITLYNDGSSWYAGFGIHNSTLGYYSGDYHRWYKTVNQTSSNFIMEAWYGTSGNPSQTGGKLAINTTALEALTVAGNISLDRSRYIFFGGNLSTTGEYIYESTPGTITIHTGGANMLNFPNNNSFFQSGFAFMVGNTSTVQKYSGTRIEATGGPVIFMGGAIGLRTNYATSEGWLPGNFNQPGYFHDNSGQNYGYFFLNGTSSENNILWSDGPARTSTGVNANPALIWRAANNDAGSNDDGGWNKAINGLSPNKAYRSVVWVRRTSASTNGTWYFGCDGGNTLNLDNSVNGNPYFNAFGIANFVQNRWYLAVGYIHANGDSSTTSYGGVYDGVTGAKVFGMVDFKMASGATAQSHRTYLYYSTDPAATLEWWGPRFEEVNGNEPTIGALLGQLSGPLFSNVQASIYYDADDNNYYADFNSTAQTAMRIRGGALHGPNPTWGAYLLVGGDGRQGYVDNAAVASVSTTNGNLHLDAASGFNTYINYYDGSIIYFANGSFGFWGEMNGGILYWYNEVRGTKFVDYNDSTYYVDPNNAGTSAGNYSANLAGSISYANYTRSAMLLNASGTSSAGAALGMQQVTAEGWTGIFVDFEPYTGWGFYHDNPSNVFSFTSEASLGSLRSFTVPSRTAGNRTAYEKFRIDQNNGDAFAGRDMYAQRFVDLNDNTYFVDPAGTSNLNAVTTVGGAYRRDTTFTAPGSPGTYVWVRCDMGGFNAGGDIVRFTINRSIFDNSNSPYGGPSMDVTVYSREWHSGQDFCTITYGEHGNASGTGGQFIANAGPRDLAGGGYWFYMRLEGGITYKFRVLASSGYMGPTWQSTSDPGGVPVVNRGFSIVYSSSNGNVNYGNITAGYNLIANNVVQSDYYFSLNNNFLFRSGANAGTPSGYNLNLRNDTADPCCTSGGTGITWGARSDNNPYYLIWTRYYANSGGGAGSTTYNRLTLNWHTGIDIGAEPAYGGTRFWAGNPPMYGSVIMYVGSGDSNVKIVNDAQASRFVDYNDNNFYLDPNSLSLLSQMRNSGTETTFGYNNASAYVRLLTSPGNGTNPWPTSKQIVLGRYIDAVGTSGSYPLYLTGEAYGVYVANNTDAAFFGLISRGANSNDYNTVISYGDDGDDVLSFRYANTEHAYLATNGYWYARRMVDYDNNNFLVDPATSYTTNINGVTSDTKMRIGLTYKYNSARNDYTGDTNYWTGVMGWGTTDFNSIMTWGSGFFDTWSSPANSPGDTSHWVGMQAYHYVNGYNSGYGWQLAGGVTDSLWWRHSWPNNSGWFKIAMYDNQANASGRYLYASRFVDADDNSRYLDPNGQSYLYQINLQNGQDFLGRNGNYRFGYNHGQYFEQNFDSAVYGGTVGQVGFFQWISEPCQTWTGAGIARNRRNSTCGWPRINPNYTSQMMRMNEGGDFVFTTGDGAGNFYDNLYLYVYGTVQSPYAMYATLFYDYNNTSFFLDPGGNGDPTPGQSSNLNGVFTRYLATGTGNIYGYGSEYQYSIVQQFADTSERWQLLGTFSQTNGFLRIIGTIGGYYIGNSYSGYNKVDLMFTGASQNGYNLQVWGEWSGRQQDGIQSIANGLRIFQIGGTYYVYVYTRYYGAYNLKIHAIHDSFNTSCARGDLVYGGNPYGGSEVWNSGWYTWNIYPGTYEWFGGTTPMKFMLNRGTSANGFQSGMSLVSRSANGGAYATDVMSALLPPTLLNVASPGTVKWQGTFSGGRSYGFAGAIMLTNNFWVNNSDINTLSTTQYGAAWIAGLDNGNQGGGIAFATTPSFNGTTGQPTERMRIFASGNTSINSTAEVTTLYVNGNIYASQNVVAYYSDARLKNVEGKIENALDKISQINGVYYTQNELAFNIGFEKDNKRKVGVLAQDVEKVLPEVVMDLPLDKRFKTVDYDKLVPLLVEAIKELKAEVDALKKGR